MLQETFCGLPTEQEIDLFRMAYLFRHQFDYLAESGSEEDPHGLTAAVSRALVLGQDSQINGKFLYEHSGRGVDSTPDSSIELFLGSHEKQDDYNFKRELAETVTMLADYTVTLFFDSLRMNRINYQNPEALQEGVLNSFLSYAKTATLGVHVEKETDHELETDPVISEIPAPTVSQTRLKKERSVGWLQRLIGK